MTLPAEDVIAIEQLLARQLQHFDRREPVPVAGAFTVQRRERSIRRG